jgi:quercetin dioxygenase-like cupin family protein
MHARQTTHEGLNTVLRDDGATGEASPGLTRKILAYNDNLMAVMHVMAAGAVIPRHSHPEDQLSYLISGHVRLLCGNTQREIRAGDSFVICILRSVRAGVPL